MIYEIVNPSDKYTFEAPDWMTPFIMDDDIKCALDDLRVLAENDARIISLETMKAHAEGFDPRDPDSRRDSPYPRDQTLQLPLGWKVSMSLEYQPHGLSRHMSMSSPVVGRVPSKGVVQWVMLALGFVRPVEMCLVYEEHFKPDRIAVNVVEPVNPTVMV